MSILNQIFHRVASSVRIVDQHPVKGHLFAPSIQHDHISFVIHKGLIVFFHHLRAQKDHQ